MTGKKRRTILIVLLALVFVISVGMMIRQQILYRRIISDSDEAARVAGLPARSSTPSATIRPKPDGSGEESLDTLPEDTLPEEAAALANVGLEALQAVNEDIVGWIAIPGTELSYPLVQGKDNQYYLKHNWKKESSGGGSVYLESTNSRDLTDYHTIIYAHRMRNDTMFGTLKYYKDPDFWREHPCVYITTEAGVYCYDIFAAQEAGVKGIVYRLDIEKSGLEEEFLQYCMEGSVIDTGLAPEAGDRILTLSTCTGNGHAKRWVVQGYLTQTYSIP